MSEQADRRVRIRVNCAQYGGSPISLFAMYDPGTEVLAIGRETPYEAADRPGFLRVTTRPSDPVHDAVFTEDDVSDAVAAFFDLASMGRVQFMDLARLNPKGKIEQDGMTESGVRYRLSPDIGNGQVAVLIAALFARRQTRIASSSKFMAQLMTI